MEPNTGVVTAASQIAKRGLRILEHRIFTLDGVGLHHQSFAN